MTKTKRDVLWEYGPYPCVGEFKFLTLNLPSHPLYDKVLALLQAGKKDDEGTQKKKNNFLDLGCCVAQELRSLAHAGIPSSQLYGADLNHKFLETSYSLFRDEGRFEGKLVAADIFAPNLLNEGGAMEGWNAKFTIVHAGLFLHLFNWEQQVDVCTTIISLLSPLLGAIFLGEMVGCAGGRECVSVLFLFPSFLSVIHRGLSSSLTSDRAHYFTGSRSQQPLLQDGAQAVPAR